MERVVRFELCRGGSLSQPDDDAPGVPLSEGRYGDSAAAGRRTRYLVRCSPWLRMPQMVLERWSSPDLAFETIPWK